MLKTPALTPEHKTKRVEFAQRNLYTDFNLVIQLKNFFL